MKISELIIKLQKFIKDYEDLNVVSFNDNCSISPIENLTYMIWTQDELDYYGEQGIVLPYKAVMLE